MLYIKADGLTVLKYPYTFSDLRADNPNTSFPDNPVEQNFVDFGASVVQPTPTPEIADREYTEEGEPIFRGGVWQQVWKVKQLPPKSEEELRAEWKAQRAAQVEAIKVTTQAGNEFDGDEVSQGRMARAVIALGAAPEGTTVNWVLSDNTVIEATPAELTEALALAGAAQAAIWVAP